MERDLEIKLDNLWLFSVNFNKHMLYLFLKVGIILEN